MIELDVAAFLIAGATVLGVGLLVVAQLIEDGRREAQRRAGVAARREQRGAERKAARAWYPAVVGPTERLACCAAPDVPDGADYCIACGKPVRP